MTYASEVAIETNASLYNIHSFCVQIGLGVAENESVQSLRIVSVRQELQTPHRVVRMSNVVVYDV